MRILIFILCLIPSISFAAGTWSHREVKETAKLWIVEFTRDGSGETRTIYFSHKIGDGSAQINRKKLNLERAYSILNNFDIGEGSNDLLVAAINYIRNNPNCTINQLCTAYDNAYPDSPWKCDKMIEEIRDFLTDELGYTPTFTQFKTYVINNVFEATD